MRGDARWGTPRASVLRGRVVEVEDDDDFGVMLRVETTCGRTVDAQPVFVGAVGEQGGYDPIPVGAAVVVLLPYGQEAGAIALSGLATARSQVPSDYDNAKSLRYGLAEHRSAAGDDVDGVLLRPLLDDLRSMAAAFKAALDALANTAPVTNDGGAALQNAMKVSWTAGGGSAAVGDAITAMDNSRAGQGAAPHCSGVLRARAGST